MALAAAPSAQQALLSLEKSKLGPEQQLDEAARILKIDFTGLADLEFTQQIHSKTSGTCITPKEEWVLRWLSKRTRAGESADRYRLNSKTWQLFAYLVPLVPRKSVARTFTEYDLLKTLEATLDSLVKESGSGQSPRDTSHKQPNLQSGSRKRKHSFLDSDITNTVGTASASFTAFEAILHGLSECIQLAQRTDDETSAQHMRAALQTESDVAARILSCLVTWVAKSSFNSRAPQELSSNALSSLSAVSEIISLWEFRKSDGLEHEGKSSNEAFVNLLLFPVLGLLGSLQSLSATVSDFRALESRLQQLVVLHALYPARSAFLSLSASQTPSSDAIPDSEKREVIATNLGFAINGAQLKTEQGAPPTRLLSILLDLGIKASPLKAVRARREELPWIYALFSVLCETGGCPITSTGDISGSIESTHCLEDCLQILQNHQVPVPLSFLTLISTTYSGLTSESANDVRWELTSRLIHSDVNLFLPNSGEDVSSKLLGALLAALSHGFADADQLLCLIQRDIVVSLIKGFVEARDMPHCLEIMRQQIAGSRNLEDLAETKNHLIWDDEDVLHSLTSICDTSMSPPIASREITRYVNDLRNRATRDAPEVGLYASTVVFGALLSADASIFANHHEELRSLLPLLSELMKGSCHTILRKSIYRLLWQIASILSQHNRSIWSPLWDQLISAALGSIKNTLEHPDVDNRAPCGESLEAFKMLLTLGRVGLPLSILEQALSSLNKCLLLWSISEGKHDTESGDSKSDTISIKQNIPFAYVASILLHTDVLSLVSEQSLLLFQTLLQCTEQSMAANSASDALSVPFLNILVAFASDCRTASNAILLGQMLDAIAAKCRSQSALHDLDVQLLLTLPLSVLSRSRKAELCDLVVGTIQRPSSGVCPFSDKLALLAELAEGADGSATILKSARFFFDFTMQCSELALDGDQTTIQRHFRKFCETIWQRILLTAGSAKFNAYLSGFRCTMLAFLQRADLKQSEAKSTFTSPTPIAVSLGYFIQLLCEHESAIESAVSPDDKSELVQTWTSLMAGDIAILTKELNSTPQEGHTRYVCWTLDALVFLARENVSLPSFVPKILSKLEKAVTVSPSIPPSQESILHRVQSLRYTMAVHDHQDDINDAGELQWTNLVHEFIANPVPSTTSRLSFEDRLAETKMRLAPLNDNVSTTMLQRLEESSRGYLHTGSLVLVVITVAKTLKITDRDSRHTQLLRRILINLQNFLPQTSDVRSMALMCDCIAYLITIHPILVNPFIFSNTLRIITLTASASGLSFSSTELPSASLTIYPRLCTLATSLLSRHRKHLRGNHHHLLQALTSLLTCLFIPHKYPYTSSTHTNPLLSLTPWSLASPPTPEMATSYTRLLTTLADPTPSSIPHKTTTSSSLNDLVARARRVEGTFLQHVIQTYCACRLHGKMDPEVKERLMPGLYALMESMGQEVMRACNGQMDAEMRGVFRALYSEWIGEGRWGGR